MVELPKGVHRVVSRGKEYFYWHPGRGTEAAGARVKLPSDPQAPEFWTALRGLQGGAAPRVTTVADVIDLYETWAKFLKLEDETKRQYRIQLRVARVAFGALAADRLRPALIRELLEGMSDRPGAANNFLGVMRALSAFGVSHDHFHAPITHGLEPYAKEGGHKPWTDAQIKAAHDHLTGMLRRGVLLALYTGQRGSDVVRLGWTDIEDGGFHLTQRKTGREVWCPVLPELAAEMATWEKRPGPFLQAKRGGTYTRAVLAREFAQWRASVPVLKSATMHGLRSTAVVHLRRAGLATAQIQDIIGMSMGMIERYSRFADKKRSGQAAVVSLKERRA